MSVEFFDLGPKLDKEVVFNKMFHVRGPDGQVYLRKCWDVSQMDGPALAQAIQNFSRVRPMSQAERATAAAKRNQSRPGYKGRVW